MGSNILEAPRDSTWDDLLCVGITITSVFNLFINNYGVYIIICLVVIILWHVHECIVALKGTCINQLFLCMIHYTRHRMLCRCTTTYFLACPTRFPQTSSCAREGQGFESMWYEWVQVASFHGSQSSLWFSCNNCIGNYFGCFQLPWFWALGRTMVTSLSIIPTTCQLS